MVREAKTVDGRDVVEIDARAGETLWLGLNNGPDYNKHLDQKSGRGAIRVVPPGGTEARALAARDPSELEDGTWINVLPKTGVYQIVVRWSSHKPYRLRITLMDPHDPRLDPGITQRQVSIDWSALGVRPALRPRRFEPMEFGYIPDYSWPAHLSAETPTFELRIMAMDGLKKVWSDDSIWSQRIARLEWAVRASEKAVSPDLLPLGIYRDGGFCFWGQQERLAGKAWTGLRLIGWFCAENSVNTDEPLSLTYVFQAVSRDNKYFIMMFADLAYPNPPGELVEMVKGASMIDNQNLSDEAYDVQFRKLEPKINRYLDGVDPDAFNPSVRQLDTVVLSIDLK